MARKREGETILIKYIFPNNYKNCEKYVEYIGDDIKGWMSFSNKKVLKTEIAKEICYKLYIYYLANNGKVSNYHKLRKDKIIKSNRNNIKDIMLISGLCKIFGINDKEACKYENEDEIKNVIKNPKIILELGWKYVFEDISIDDLDELEISNSVWKVFEKALSAFDSKKEEINLTKKEEREIIEALLGDIKNFTVDSWLDSRRRINEDNENIKIDKSIIYEKIKNIVNEEAEIVVEKVDGEYIENKGQILQIANYLRPIFAEIAQYKIWLPILPKTNTRTPKIEFTQNLKPQLSIEEKKRLASLKRKKNFASEIISNIWKEDFVRKYYRFGELLINACEEKEDSHINYYLFEQVFAFELFEYEIQILMDIFCEKYQYSDNILESEKKFITESLPLGRILRYIYEFPYVFERKHLAKKIIVKYYKMNKKIRRSLRWFTEMERIIEKKQKSIERMEPVFMYGLFYGNNYSLNDVKEKVDNNGMSWYENKKGKKEEVFEILKRSDSLIAKWVIHKSLEAIWIE